MGIYGADKTTEGIILNELPKMVHRSTKGEWQKYNIFKFRMLVRHDADGKVYLYDFLRTKKETSSPFQ